VIGWTSGGVRPGLVCIGMDKPLRTAKRLAEDRTDEQGPSGRLVGGPVEASRICWLVVPDLHSSQHQWSRAAFRSICRANSPAAPSRDLRAVARGGRFRSRPPWSPGPARPWPRAAGLFPHSRAGIFAGNPSAAAIALADRRANRSPIQPPIFQLDGGGDGEVSTASDVRRRGSLTSRIAGIYRGQARQSGSIRLGPFEPRPVAGAGCAFEPPHKRKDARSFLITAHACNGRTGGRSIGRRPRVGEADRGESDE
jgi:hypothetical protein